MVIFSQQVPPGDYVRAAEDETSIGNILIELGHVTQGQLSEAVEVQRSRVPELGGVLIELGFINPEQLDEALLRQRILRGKASKKEITEYERRKRKRASALFIESANQTREVAANLKLAIVATTPKTAL